MRRFNEWCEQYLREHERIPEAGSHAAQKAKKELVSHEELGMIYAASRAADNWQSDLFPTETQSEAENRERLQAIRREIETEISSLADRVIREAVSDVEVFGHRVDLTHKIALNPCLSCDESTEAYFIGHSRSNTAAFVCGCCGAEIGESHAGRRVLSEGEK